jgi:UDP-N-acetylmuramoylalanine--D-glutamate ligase
MKIKGKKILLMGLGILGGGVATAKWLVSKGAKLTITDLRSEEYLKPSIAKLSKIKNKILFVLKEHREKDFLENEIIVVNPDVPIISPFLEIARKNGKQIENELTLFYKFCPSRNIIAVTGTRGKTTTANWIWHFIKKTKPNSLITGNSPEKPLLDILNKVKKNTLIVIEEPSFLLENLSDNNAPYVAAITNLYRDHINRHGTMEGYALAKANIFKNQNKNDFLILNYNNEWTSFFLKQNPVSKVLLFSSSELPKSKEGIFVNKKMEVIIRLKDREEKIAQIDNFVASHGIHNLENLLIACLTSFISNNFPKNINKAIATLPQIKFREEKIYEDKFLEIYNDSAATSPEASISAMQRFGNGKNNLMLISGGTDKELEFKNWAKNVKRFIVPGNLILLEGSATEKMKKLLGNYEFEEYDSLEECLDKALVKAKKSKEKKTTVVFSPASKSFEKFKNEFDRGEKFNLIFKKLSNIVSRTT